MCANPILPDYCTVELHPTQNVPHHWNTSSVPMAIESGLHHGDYHAEVADDHSSTDFPADHGGDGGHHECTPSDYPYPNTALFAIILTMGTFLIAFFLRYFRTSQFLGRTVSAVLLVIYYIRLD